MPAPKGMGRDIYTEEEVQKLLNEMPDEETRSLTAFLYLTGCRINEALDLVKTNDTIRFDDYYFYVRLRTLKTKASIPFRDLQIRLEAPYLKEILAWMTKVKGGERVWTIPSWTYRRRLQAIIPEGWIHLFRHTRMTKFAQQGFNEFQIVQWAGWEDSRPASHYIKKTQKMIKDMADKIQ